MNNVFDINRFGKLCLRELDIYKAGLMWVVIAAFGLFCLSAIFSLAFNTKPVELFGFTKMAYVLVIVAPLFFFKNRGRISSILEFTLPASTTEKFFVKLLFCLVIMPALVLLLLLLLSALYMLLPGINFHETGSAIYQDIRGLSFEDVTDILAIQSIFLLGTFFFRKNVFVKVCLCLLLYFMVCVLVFVLSHEDLFAMGQGGNYTINIGHVSVTSFFSHGNNMFQYYIFNLISPIGLWVVSFLKLREIEI
jgi:hypothetical protein